VLIVRGHLQQIGTKNSTQAMNSQQRQQLAAAAEMSQASQQSLRANSNPGGMHGLLQTLKDAGVRFFSF